MVPRESPGWLENTGSTGSARDSMGAVASRLCLELALADTGVTVTAFLERIAGEAIDAHDRRHVMTQAAKSNPLGAEEGCPLLQRSAVLQGRMSAQPYLYAESLLVPSRLPASFCPRLETSRDPIGRLLSNEGIGFTRSPLSRPHRPGASTDASPVPDDYLLARRYRLDIDGLPVMVVAEWFLPALEPFLTSP